MRVISKKHFEHYEEWKIEYNVESSDTMPAEAGRVVPAYLLIPKHAPGKCLPALICFHQCGIDCTVGKEAVVGRLPDGPVELAPLDRSDQAYGRELVKEGFVVIAPDAINCGERHIPQIRDRGQVKKCWYIVDGPLGREAWSKRVYDGMRAIDLLESLEFVDPKQIGAVGHSMGAEDVYYLMALDERVKAGIRSGEGFRPDDVASKFLALHSPRLSIGLRGSKDDDSSFLESVQTMYANARLYYESDGVPGNLVLVVEECGHTFTDSYKQQAFQALKQHFGL